MKLFLTLSVIGLLTAAAYAAMYPGNDLISRKIAEEGIVLLQNEGGALPLSPSNTVAVFGPNQLDYFLPRDEDQFVRELRESILPLLVDTYSTYAHSSSQEDISAAREHFAYAGLSMGSIYAYTSIMPKCLDLFAWFGCFSGSDAYLDKLIPALQSEENVQYPIRYFYNCIGDHDSMFDTHTQQYDYLVRHVDCLTDGKNAAMTVIKDASHEYRAWGTGLYNFLRVVFAQPTEP